MSDPFSGTPDSGTSRPTRRRFQPGPVQEAVREMRDALRIRLLVAQATVRRGKRESAKALRLVRQQSQELWRRGRRNPRNVGLAAGAVALTLAGAYTLSGSAAGRSLCPSPSSGKAPKYLLLMDSLPNASAGSDLEIHYDVCGLASGSPYKGRVQVRQQIARKKGSAKAQPKPQAISFKDHVDGVATRRLRRLSLASTKPGTYLITLAVADGRGRQRARVQKILITAP